MGTRRWCAGVRPVGVSKVRSRVGGGGSAVGWAPGQSRPRSSGHLLGLRVAHGPHPGCPAALPPPQAWTQEKTRLEKAGVPTARRGYRTRHQWALEMLEKNGAALPHRWMAGDDEMGRPYWLRRRLAALGER